MSVDSTMTTINNIEDLIKLLDENPQWLEALRVRLLTRELIELPEKFAQFATSTNQRLGRLETDVSALKGDVRVLKDDVRDILLKDDVHVLRDDVQVLKSDVKGIRDSLGPIRGTHAINAARDRVGYIAEKFGLDWSRTLNREEVRQMVRGLNVGEIPQGDRESFGEADIVMEARDSADGTCYVAVEVSYTVDESDTERAIRNAGFLARLTGRPAYAVVAGLRYDDRVMPHIQSGEVTWYQMPPRWLQPE